MHADTTVAIVATLRESQREIEAMPTLIDAHVHLHACHDWGRVLDSALRNFTQTPLASTVEAQRDNVLLLTEMRSDDAFAALRSGAGSARGWRFEPTGEAESLCAVRSTGARLCLVAGRQIETLERIEVHAIATDKHFEDGRPVSDTLAAVSDSGALPVLPWGFGKWWGKRGSLVRRLVRTPPVPHLALGDNAGRPTPSLSPLLLFGAKCGLKVLPGTDPLRIASHQDLVGSFGWVLSSRIDAERPAAWLRAALRDGRTAGQVFGRRLSFADALRAQWALRRLPTSKPVGDA
jgi:hypothetical protein